MIRLEPQLSHTKFVWGVYWSITKLSPSFVFGKPLNQRFETFSTARNARKLCPKFKTCKTLVELPGRNLTILIQWKRCVATGIHLDHLLDSCKKSLQMLRGCYLTHIRSLWNFLHHIMYWSLDITASSHWHVVCIQILCSWWTIWKSS